MAASSSTVLAPSDSFTPQRAQKGYSELNVNHIFTGTNQLTVSLSHRKEFNHSSALRASPFWWGCGTHLKEKVMAFQCGGKVGVFLSPRKGSGYCESLMLVCMVLWYPSHDCLLVNTAAAMGWAVVPFTADTRYVLDNLRNISTKRLLPVSYRLLEPCGK